MTLSVINHIVSKQKRTFLHDITSRLVAQNGLRNKAH